MSINSGVPMNLRHFTNGLKFHSQALTGALPNSSVCSQESNCLCRLQQSQQNPKKSRNRWYFTVLQEIHSSQASRGAANLPQHSLSTLKNTTLRSCLLFLQFTFKPIKVSWWNGCSGNRSPRYPSLPSFQVLFNHPGELWTPTNQPLLLQHPPFL